jgi:transcriptional regulator with XRE-family HTH domain
MLLGKCLSAYRKSEGISLRKFAKAANVQHTTLLRVEGGEIIEDQSFASIMVLLLKDKPEAFQSTTQKRK